MEFTKPSPQSDVERGTYVPCDVATDTRDAIIGLIEEAIQTDPRSLQTTIGPSSIGDPCDFCLAHRLLGDRTNSEPAWLTLIGRAVHSELERIFRRAGPPWYAEARNLYVGDVDGERITGTSDLFHLQDGVVTDFKVVGDRTLTTARQENISPSYRVQNHVYGRGWSLLGYDVKIASILYLPRNRQTLRSAVWWAEPYSEQVALDAIVRADRLARRLRTLGREVVLPTLERMPGCYDCRRWERP